MSRFKAQLLERLASAVIPEADREVVLGDLEEEGFVAGSVRHMAAVAGIVASHELEGWRDGGARRGAVITLFLGVALVWAVRAAGLVGTVTIDPLQLFTDPVSRAAVILWSATNLTGAAAAGLLVGLSPWLPSFAGSLRWHIAFILAGLAWWSAPGAGIEVAGVLLFGAWLGSHGRAPEVPPLRD
jgi:hypothetical protein